MFGLSALTWVLLIPATLCWPVAGYFIWRVFKSSQRHHEHDRIERERLLAAAASAADAPPAS